MDRAEQITNAPFASPRPLRAVFAVLLLALAGCQSMPPLPEPRIEPVDEPAVRPPPPRVLLVLADEQPSLEAVFDELSRRLPANEFDAVSLAGATALPEHIVEGIGSGDYRASVAVGYGAGLALTGQALDIRIFCQIFDHRELTADGMAGVAVLPSPRQTLEAWKRISPELEVIGMLTGSGMAELTAEVAAAAAALDLELIHREVDSDQAYYQAFRGISRKIDGLLLIPDHRVLSPAVIDRLFVYADKRSVKVLAFTPSLLDRGAVAVSVNEPRDVASQVLSLLNNSELFEATRGEVLPLTLARIETEAGSGSPGVTAIGRHAQLD